mmetsp:Transcript_7540/g.18714  ORF Transcript_7540/g.18714 Transcript_7540/m.18714 type:complete len:326 (-) Transcript_7540:164-1141(-)
MVFPPAPTISDRKRGCTDTDDSPKPSACRIVAYPRSASSRTAAWARCRDSGLPSVIRTVAVDDDDLLLPRPPPPTGRNWLPALAASSSLGARTSSLVPVFSWMAHMVAPFGPMMIPIREASIVTLREVAVDPGGAAVCCCFLTDAKDGFFFLPFLGIVSHASSSTAGRSHWAARAAATDGAGVGAGGATALGDGAAEVALPEDDTADPFFFGFFRFFFVPPLAAVDETAAGIGDSASSSAASTASGADIGAAASASAAAGDAFFFFFVFCFFFFLVVSAPEAMVVAITNVGVAVFSASDSLLFLDRPTNNKAIATPMPMAAMCVR